MNLLIKRIGLVLVLAASALLAGGCGTLQLGQPQPSLENIQAMKAAKFTKSGVGRFTLAEGKDPSLDKYVGVRAHALEAPQGSFARYLQETLEAELRAAGLLDPAAEALIEGYLIDRQLDPAIGQGSGKLAARFIASRQGKVVFDRELAAESTWESSFVGAIAIPMAIHEFNALFRKLVAKLIQDPDFISAMAQ